MSLAQPEKLIGGNTCVHNIGHDKPAGWCDDCQARIDAFKSGRCLNCRTRPATIDWVGDGGVLAFTHGMSERWCEPCAWTAQLEHARKMALQIPELEVKLGLESAAPAPPAIRALPALWNERLKGFVGEPSSGLASIEVAKCKDELEQALAAHHTEKKATKA